MIVGKSKTVAPSVAPPSRPSPPSRPAPPAPDLAPVRRFWLCADDYGLSPGVSRAIRDLLARGRLNAASVMVVAPTFSAAEAEPLLALAGAGRRVALGLHFTLTAPFRPLAGGYRPRSRDGAFPSMRRMFAAGLLGVLDTSSLGAEAERQLAVYRSAFGRPPDFVDGHQHVHLLPQVSDALLAAMKTAAPRAFVRQCGRARPPRRRWSDPKGLLLDGLSRSFRARSAKAGFSTNPAFAGTYNFRPDADYEALFPSFLEGLPDGGLVMCHPGFVDAELRRLDSLTALREREYSFFAGDSFLRLLAHHGLALA
jgi:chitin disaccharide deacetylase